MINKEVRFDADSCFASFQVAMCWYRGEPDPEGEWQEGEVTSVINPGFPHPIHYDIKVKQARCSIYIVFLCVIRVYYSIVSSA